jgi:upstream activation factor subunit UAF30
MLPSSCREILCDAKLTKVFKRNKVGMFKMAKYLSEMMKPVHQLQEGMKSKSAPKAQKKAIPKAKKSEKKVKKMTAAKAEKERLKLERRGEMVEKMRESGVGIHKHVKLSEPLAKLLGIESSTRPQVVSHMWTYIKAKNLQNPDKKSEIFLDKELQAIFGVEKVTMFSMNKHLSEHLS